MGSCEHALMDVVQEAVLAIEHRDWTGLRILLHPYIHWTGDDGGTIRGRKNVLERLKQTAPSGPPAMRELRDGQIYRWVESRDRLDLPGSANRAPKTRL